MGETLRQVATGFNRSLTVETRSERLTGDPGAVLLREVLDTTVKGAIHTGNSGRLLNRGISRIEQGRTGGRGCKQLVYGLDSPSLHLRFLR